MKNVEQIYTSCLAQGAYFIESEGEAAVIDPLRETHPYTERAVARGVRIKYIFETHFHADFVSGHVDLASETGASIVYGPTAETDYDSYIAHDGEEFKIGKLTIKVLHTPGHTPESTTFLLKDTDGNDVCIFTGDTLFIGDVGRPDLAQKATNFSTDELAGMLYDSLRSKIMPLPDNVIVYPAHGAGSACGKHMSNETSSTLGEQKKSNYALRTDMTRNEFIKEVTDGLMAPPQYFAKNVSLNKKGYTSIDEVLDKGVTGLSLDKFKELAGNDDVLVLDVRDNKEFNKGFIPGSLFIGLNGSFAPWVGAMIENINQKIILIAPKGKEKEAVTRLARVGYDNVLGYLEDGFEKWSSSGGINDDIFTISVSQFTDRIKNSGTIHILDARKPAEHDLTHIATAISFPLDFLPSGTSSSLDSEKEYHIHCQGGYRSTIMCSWLKRDGYDKIINIQGHFDDIKSSGIPVEGTCESLKNH